jgi:mevalonate kinase
MGSSAATVLSEIRALGHYLRVDFKPEWYYEYSLEVERLQHGYPSGIDSYMSLHGGCTYFKEGQGQKIPMPSIKMFLVETGIPASSTGVCVESVRNQFGSSSIWSEFESVTEEVRTYLETNEQSNLYESIRANHRLLDQIGVVPGRVSQFINEIEARGGAAKICGAGAVEGEAAGVLIVLAEEAPTALCEQYGYTVSSLRGDPLGTRLV